VVRLQPLRGPLVAGLLWGALALASTAVRDQGGAVTLIWLPSAVAVASLYATPLRRWPLVVTALMAAQVATYAVRGTPLSSGLAFAFANQVEAVICAGVGIRVLGGRGRTPQTFKHVAGLFVAAVLGCTVGALISAPFSYSPGFDQPLRWFLASVLGVLTATPVLLFLRQRLGIGDQSVRFWRSGGRRGFLFAVAAMVLLGGLVLASPVRGLTPVLFVAIVFAVFR
jgi:integral membrane sensor domain MASE1